MCLAHGTDTASVSILRSMVFAIAKPSAFGSAEVRTGTNHQETSG